MMRRSRLRTPRWRRKREREFTTEFAEGTEKRKRERKRRRKRKRKKKRGCSADLILRTWGAAVLRPYMFCGDDRDAAIG